MSLPAQQRRVLERIECTLRGSDPRLAALYAIFSRLNHDEEMPRIEQLRHNALQVLAGLRAMLARLSRRVVIRLIPRRRAAAAFFPLALVIVTVSIVLAARSSSGHGCTTAKTVAASRLVPKSKVCKSPAMSPVNYGH